MVLVIYEDLGKGCRYIKTGPNHYEEIPSEDEWKYRGCRVSHGYMHQCTADHVLWQEGLNERPTIEDKLMREEQ